MNYHIEKLISELEIEKCIERLSKEIKNDFKNEDVLLIGILRGSVIFLADIARKIGGNTSIDFMIVSSYGNSTHSSEKVYIKKDLEEDIFNRNVIIIEDIVDTGLTLYELKKELLKRKPKSLKICALLDKPDRRERDIYIDYIGIQIPDVFVVGYGIDYAQKYRTLPYIGKVVFNKE